MGYPIRLKCYKYIFIITAALSLRGGYVCPQQSQNDSIKVFGGLDDAVAFSIDPAGNIFVIDRGSSEVLKLEGGKIVARFGGIGWDNNSLEQPRDVVSENGLDVYVADYGNHRIVRFDRNLIPISEIPSEEMSRREKRLFGYPRSIAQSRFGDLFVLDGENTRLVKIKENNSIDKSIGGMDAGKGRLRLPTKVRISNQEHIFVQDGNQIVVFDIVGNFIKSFGKTLFKKIQAFAASDSNIILLDSCSVYWAEHMGRMKKIFYIGDIIEDCTEIRDIIIADEQLYLLGKHDIFRIKL